MKHKLFFLVFFLFFITVHSTLGQSRVVKLKFEIDRKPFDCNCSLVLYDGYKEIIPKNVGDGFEVPKEIEYYERIGVKFLCGRNREHKLDFGYIYRSKFQTDWVVGIDTKPFDSELLPTVLPEKEVGVIYYIRFESEKGDGTIISIEVPKRQTPKKMISDIKELRACK